MFDPPTYKVDEGGTVHVVVQLCGSITDNVVVSIMTKDGTAGIARPSTVYISDGALICMYMYISTIMRERNHSVYI